MATVVTREGGEEEEEGGGEEGEEAGDRDMEEEGEAGMVVTMATSREGAEEGMDSRHEVAEDMEREEVIFRPFAYSPLHTTYVNLIHFFQDVLTIKLLQDNRSRWSSRLPLRTHVTVVTATVVNNNNTCSVVH